MVDLRIDPGRLKGIKLLSGKPFVISRSSTVQVLLNSVLDHDVIAFDVK